MASDAKSSQGAMLQIGDGADPTEAFTTIAEVKDFQEPAQPPAKHDVTSHSTVGGVKEYILGMSEAGEVTVEVNYTGHATHTTLRTKKASKARTNFRMLDPDGEGIQFAAFVADFVRKHPVDGVRTADVTLFVTGALSDVTEESP